MHLNTSFVKIHENYKKKTQLFRLNMHESFFDVLHIGVNEHFLNFFEDYAKHDKPSIQSIHLQKILFSANHFTLNWIYF